MTTAIPLGCRVSSQSLSRLLRRGTTSLAIPKQSGFVCTCKLTNESSPLQPISRVQLTASCATRHSLTRIVRQKVSHLQTQKTSGLSNPRANNTNFAVALTIRWLARPAATKAAAAVPGSKPAFRMISCTGERMETLLVTKLYRSLGLRTTDYEPVHARCLNNEFYCYANFECDRWSWVAKDDQ